MAQGERRPLVIVAGFLGAGKTSFLRDLVPALIRLGLRPRVILNDIENARIDAATLGDLRAELTALTGSCLCCDTQDELIELLGAPSQGEHDTIVLEANGTSDTGALLETLADAPSLGHLLSPLQITIIDAVRFGKRGWMSAIEREQLMTSSHLRVSKTDLVDASRVEEVRAAARSAAPAAVWTNVESFAGDVADRVIVKRPDGAGQRPGGAAASTVHRHQFLSCQIPIPFAVDALAFEEFLRGLPHEIVRAKGVVVVTDPPGEKRSFQLASGRAEVSPCALQDPDDLSAVAVFVGGGIDVPALEQAIAAMGKGRVC